MLTIIFIIHSLTSLADVIVGALKIVVSLLTDITMMYVSSSASSVDVQVRVCMKLKLAAGKVTIN